MVLSTLRRRLPLLGFVLLGLLLLRVDLGEVASSLRGLEPGWLAAAGLLSLAEMVLRGGMLRTLARKALGWQAALRITLVGHALGFVTPARAGDFGKVAWLAAEAHLSAGGALRIVTADRVALAGTLLAWGTLGLGLHVGQLGPACTVAALLVAATAVAAHLLVPGGAPAAPVTAWLVWALHFARGWCLARALGLDLSLLPFLALSGAAAVAESLPMSVLGFGVREWSLAILLAPYAVTLPQVLALSMLSFGLGLAWVLPGLACSVPAGERAPQPLGVAWPGSRKEAACAG